MIKTKLIRYRGFAVGLTMLMILSVWLLIGEGAKAYGYAGSNYQIGRASCRERV